MSNKVNRIKVIIDDTMYELTSQDSPEYIQSVAAYIDRKIKSIYSKKSEASINPRLKTLFISLNIADDLFKEMERSKELEVQYRLSQERLARSDEESETLSRHNMNLSEENDFLKRELDKVRLELEEYMLAYETEQCIDKNEKVTRLKR